MKANKTSTNTTKTTKKRRMGWASVWALAFLFALPSCFEISCIKLVGCELLADEAGDGPQSGLEFEMGEDAPRPELGPIEQITRDLFE